MTRERLSASVDAEVIAAGRDAVEEGRAETLSAWVNDALHRQVVHDRRLTALDDFLAAFEAEQGEIAEEEQATAVRRAQRMTVFPTADADDEKSESGAA